MATGGKPAERDGVAPLGRRFADAGLALLVVLVVGMMIVPLPTPLLDVLIAGNIAIGVLLLLVSVYAPDALAFTSFPTILLVTTLFRLALNVSSTRLILLQADAGEVIRAFGHFVVQGNYVVGGVVFLILTLIQFVVIAKGSERVAEVGARFTLDAMPGKQMAIDAELRTGALGQEEARHRRRALQRESQFYGAMDGAMKFVKGDAVAGIVITAINVVGGLAIGVAMRDLGAGESLRVYGLLTIGDGLVSQIPSLLISTAAGIVVTRVASEDEESSLGADVGRQIFGDPRALAIAAGFLVVLGIVPGLPSVPFFVLAAVFALIAWRLSRRPALAPGAADAEADRREARREAIARGQRSPQVTPVSIDLGPGLAAALLDGRGGGPLLEHAIPAVREALFRELGLGLPAVRAALDPALPPGGYVIRIQEVPVSRGVGTPADPEASRVVAEALGLEVRRRAGDLLGLQEVQAMLDQLEASAPVLVRHVVPKPVSLPVLAEVLRRLVGEGVSIRALREILEALALHAPTEKDPAALAELVRRALRRHITHAHAGAGGLAAYRIDPDLEDAIRDAIQRTGPRTYLALPPSTARDVLAAVRTALGDAGGRPVLLAQADVRRFVRELLEPELPDVVVLSPQELDPAVTVATRGRVSL